MNFESVMSFFFGDAAYQIAGTVGDATERKKWLRRAAKKLMQEANKLDTAPRHSAMLMKELEEIHGLIERASHPSWDLVLGLFRLSFRLLGFDYRPGRKCHTLVYFQTPAQYYAFQALGGADVLQPRKDRREAASLRQAVVRSLKANGVDDFRIALVLNTSEYKVKQLRGIPNAESRE